MDRPVRSVSHSAKHLISAVSNFRGSMKIKYWLTYYFYFGGHDIPWLQILKRI